MGDARKRLLQEYKKMMMHPMDGIAARPMKGNIFKWKAALRGPKNTCFEGGIYKIIIEFPEDYPFLPPKMKMKSDIYHPNIYADGTICMSILYLFYEDEYGFDNSVSWCPAQNISSILLSFLSMLDDPNMDHIANADVGILYQTDKKKYESLNRQKAAKSVQDAEEKKNKNKIKADLKSDSSSSSAAAISHSTLAKDASSIDVPPTTKGSSTMTEGILFSDGFPPNKCAPTNGNFPTTKVLSSLTEGPPSIGSPPHESGPLNKSSSSTEDDPLTESYSPNVTGEDMPNDTIAGVEQVIQQPTTNNVETIAVLLESAAIK